MLGSLFLMTVPPLSVHVLTFALLNPTINGSLVALLNWLWDNGSQKGVPATLSLMLPSWSEVTEGGKHAVAFGLIQLLLMWIVPGHLHTGPIAPSGHQPTYKANGVQCYILTIVLWAVCSLQLELFDAGFQHTHASGMFAFLNMAAVLLVVVLYFKGRFAPSTKDSGCSGNLIFDMFWGTELYPRFGKSIWPVGWDVKMFTNCRFGLMYWGLSGLSYAAAQYNSKGFVSSSMLVSSLVQVLYISLPCPSYSSTLSSYPSA